MMQTPRRGPAGAAPATTTPTTAAPGYTAPVVSTGPAPVSSGAW